MPATKIDKPWGHEILLTETDLPYVAKILFIEAGKKLSLQYHDQKSETLTLFSGQANLSLGQDQANLQTISMLPKQGYTIRPNTIHRIIAITDTTIFEASTPEIGTTYRLEDDYNRLDENLDIKN